MTSRRSAGSSERAFSIANGWQRWADAISAGLRASVPFVFHRLSRSPEPIEAAMIWLRRLDNQPAHAWLRDVINRVASGLRLVEPAA
jgi:hypothetical protein